MENNKLSNFYFIKPTLLVLFILFLPVCKPTQQSNVEIPKVQSVPWEKSMDSIPEQLRSENPIASPNAVKGGIFRIYAHQFPKSLNYYLEQFATTAEIFTLMHETLTKNHPVTLEKLPNLAKSWEISQDKKKYTFHIDQNAQWSDGKPVTAHDVLFTYQTIMDKKHNTAVVRIGLSRFFEPKVIDDFTIEFTTKDVHWDNFNNIAGGLWILPKHAYEGKDFNKINFEFPVVSGPYKLVEAKKGRYVKMQRRGDWWQRAYPFNKGTYNFDQLLYKVFNESNIALQSMKKGDMDIFPVYTASEWVKDTIDKKFTNNWIAKQRIFNQKPIGFQGWAMNARKEIFKDKRVREAMCHLINRELMVEKLAYNEYALTNSYYPDFYTSGEPNPNKPCVYDVEKARGLLKEAGWKANKDGILEKNGKKLSFVILDRDKRTEKYFTIFMEDLKKVGIQASMETTDLAAWSARIEKYDFEMTWTAWGGAVFKDPETLWASKYIQEPGQYNLAAFSHPKVDKLIEDQKVEFDLSKRNQMVKEIDKLVYQEYPYVLLWHMDHTRLLYWNRFGMPGNPLGKYGDEGGATQYWWFDEEKNKALEKAMQNDSPLPRLPEKVYWKE
ncbi:MAG: ABC transporter substrate-binding protein [Leptospiraceae bacterium]|nr:ABC transporter substrate-binding protein [Leptospiraceae bacterium]MCP5495894.1 ABC transporter substrate-binding protein [Leptospiraceae bacterium]